MAAEDLLPARADADHVDGHADLFFNEGQIGLRSGREIIPVGRTSEIRLPTREFLIDRGGPVKHRLVVGHPLVAFAIVVLGHADLQRVQGIEDVELGNGQLGK